MANGNLLWPKFSLCLPSNSFSSPPTFCAPHGPTQGPQLRQAMEMFQQQIDNNDLIIGRIRSAHRSSTNPLSEVPKRGRSKRGRTQKHANAHKRAQKSAKERKRAQKSTKKRFCVITLKTLTSLNKEVRPFFLGDNSIWSLPSVSSLSDYSIWRSWGRF